MNKRRRFKAKAQRRRIAIESRRLHVGYLRAKQFIAAEAYDRRVAEFMAELNRVSSSAEALASAFAGISTVDLAALAARSGRVAVRWRQRIR